MGHSALRWRGWEVQGQEGLSYGVGGKLYTSLGRKGLKKQSSSLRKLMIRLLLVEVITSLTEDRTKLMDSCGSENRALVAGTLSRPRDWLPTLGLVNTSTTMVLPLPPGS